MVAAGGEWSLVEVIECINCACSLWVFGLMVVFNIGCICWAASLGGIICWINSAICLKSSYSLGGFILWVSLGGFNWGYDWRGPLFCFKYIL